MTIVKILEAGNVPHQVNAHELKFNNNRKKSYSLLLPECLFTLTGLELEKRKPSRSAVRACISKYLQRSIT